MLSNEHLLYRRVYHKKGVSACLKKKKESLKS
nr:MAG TPA: hypothetical protein [Caudoviricetes sp.]